MNSILLKNRPILDSGATGTVYAYEHNMVIKVFSPKYPLWKVEREYNNFRLFNHAGLPSPECRELVSTDKGFGIISERIDGISLTKAIIERPAKLNSYVNEMIALMRKIHSVDADPSHINSAKDVYLKYLTECSKYYSHEDVAKLRDLILAIPNKAKLLHGDFHTGNIMVNKNDELILIDFAEVCYGHPIFDIMAEGAIIPVTLENDYRLAESYLGMSSELMLAIWEKYLHAYFPLVSSCDDLMREIELLSRLRNAITAAITDGIPEAYLINCADHTRSLLIPKIPQLIHTDWQKWE